MIDLQNCKFVNALSPQSINGTDTDGNAIDMKGYAYLCLVYQTGAVGAADFDALQVKECETSGGSYTAITGTAMTAPTQSNDDVVWAWFIPWNGQRKRYAKINANPGAAATLMSAVAILGRAEQSPATATERGLVQNIVL